jgi:hypothetical protein
MWRGLKMSDKPEYFYAFKEGVLKKYIRFLYDYCADIIVGKRPDGGYDFFYTYKDMIYYERDLKDLYYGFINRLKKFVKDGNVHFNEHYKALKALCHDNTINNFPGKITKQLSPFCNLLSEYLARLNSIITHIKELEDE